MDTSKLLALKLSALNDADFEWVYSRLKREAKDKLDPIVSEIKEIGFEVSLQDIDGLVEKNLVNQQISKKEQDESFHIVAEASYEEIQKIFRSESSVLYNTLISIDNWEWKADKRFLANISVNGGVKITEIDSKKLLTSSVINAAAKLIKENRQRTLMSKRPSKPVGVLTSTLDKVFRRST